MFFYFPFCILSIVCMNFSFSSLFYMGILLCRNRTMFVSLFVHLVQFSLIYIICITSSMGRYMTFCLMSSFTIFICNCNFLSVTTIWVRFSFYMRSVISVVMNFLRRT